MKTQINFDDYFDVRDNLMALRTNLERRKLLYKWVKNRKITFEQFDELIYYIR